MNPITMQFDKLFENLTNLLQNSKEFKDNFIILQIGKETIFADKNLNSHFSINFKNNSINFDYDSIKHIKTF